MKRRYRGTSPIVPIQKPTDLMRSILGCCEQTLNTLFSTALELDGRNEWMVFLVGLNDANIQRLFPKETRPKSLPGEYLDTKYGQAFATVLPVQMFDHPDMSDHPFTAPIRAYGRRIGTDCFTILYAHGQVYVGALQHDLGVSVESRVVPHGTQDRVLSVLPFLVPRLRSVLPEDSIRFRVPATQLAYHVQFTVNRDSSRPVSLSDFEQMNSDVLLTAVDAFPFDRFIEKCSKHYSRHPHILEHIRLPILDGCFRVLISLFGTVAVMDFPVIDPNRLYSSSGLAS